MSASTHLFKGEHDDFACAVCGLPRCLHRTPERVPKAEPLPPGTLSMHGVDYDKFLILGPLTDARIEHYQREGRYERRPAS